MDTTKVIIADKQLLTRTGIIVVLKELKKFDIIEIAENRSDLFEKLTQLRPQVLIIDYNQFDFTDILEFSEIQKIAPDTSILIITDTNAPEDILSIIDCGIGNYILKKCEKHELIEALNATINKEKYFCKEAIDALLKSHTKETRVQKPLHHLTSSEIVIVKLIAQGLTTKEIAAKKFLSYHTVITHRKNIFKKLDINSTSELMMYAVRNGILDDIEYYI
jgi:DNA-binding NarL/FixJ family response regulator